MKSQCNCWISAYLPPVHLGILMLVHTLGLVLVPLVLALVLVLVLLAFVFSLLLLALLLGLLLLALLLGLLLLAPPPVRATLPVQLPVPLSILNTTCSQQA